MNHISWHILGRAAYFAIFPEIWVDDGVHIFCRSFYFLQALLSIEFSHAIHTGSSSGDFKHWSGVLLLAHWAQLNHIVPCSHTHISNYRPGEDWTLCQKLVLKDIIILSQLAQTLLYSEL